MRHRFTFAATVGLLILAACSDDNRQGPTEPAPQFDKGVPCPGTTFPLSSANSQINVLYANNATLRKTMLAKAADIAQKWSQCKVADPQAKVVTFVNTLLADFRASRLAGGTADPVPTRVITLINTMFSGVGLGSPFPTGAGTDLDFGSGYFTPGTPLTVRSSLGDGGVRLNGNAFPVPGSVTVLRLDPGNSPFGEGDPPVSPPFFEITFSSVQGKHYLSNGKAIVGLCADLTEFIHPAIAHIAVTEGTHPGGFEIPEEASAADFNSLGLTDCPPLPTGIGDAIDGGLPGLTQYASSAIKSLLLPQRLEAAVGKTGLGTLATSLSPFGVTERFTIAAYQDSENSYDGDPTERTFNLNSDPDLQWEGYSGTNYPAVTVLDGNGYPVSGVPVTVQLISVSGASGSFASGSVTTVTTSNDDSPFFGVAVFDALNIAGPVSSNNVGEFELRFSAPGVVSFTTGIFTIDSQTF